MLIAICIPLTMAHACPSDSEFDKSLCDPSACQSNCAGIIAGAKTQCIMAGGWWTGGDLCYENVCGCPLSAQGYCGNSPSAVPGDAGTIEMSIP
jgi:hypothetical protein